MECQTSKVGNRVCILHLTSCSCCCTKATVLQQVPYGCIWELLLWRGDAALAVTGHLRLVRQVSGCRRRGQADDQQGDDDFVDSEAGSSAAAVLSSEVDPPCRTNDVCHGKTAMWHLYGVTHSLTRSLRSLTTHPPTHPPTHPLTHPPTHPLTHSPTHSLTH